MAPSKLTAITGTGLLLGLVAICSPAFASSSRGLTQTDGVIGIPGERSTEGLARKSRVEHARPKRVDLRAPIALHLDLGPLSLKEVEAVQDRKITKRRRVGTHRRLPAAWSVPLRGKNLAWEPVPGGGEVATFSLTSPGALSLRLAIDFERLPEGAEIRFYSPRDLNGPNSPIWANGPFEASFLLPEAGKNRKKSLARHVFWSPVIGGDTIAMEVFVPAWRGGEDVVFLVDRVSHIDQSLEPGVEEGPGDSGSCNRNLSCSPKWQESGDAVAMFLLESGNSTFQCTGQMIVDGDPDTDKRWFLTAAHCVVTKAEARSMTFFFLYQQARCNGGLSPMDQLGGGAKLKATTGGGGVEEGDHTLVLLKKKPPEGVNYQGIAAGGDHVGSKNGASIGHPSADDKKVALLKKVDQTVGVDSSGSVFEPGSSHYVVRWKKKTVTEPGSSGSSLMVGRKWPNQFAIGVLTGGFSSCEDTKGPDFYGSFSYVVENFSKFRKLLSLN